MTEQEKYLEENLAKVRARMEDAARRAVRSPQEILLCAASKTQSVETVRLASRLNIDLFGENHVQELVEKYDAGAYNGKPAHMIGHLQTNKVKQVVGRAALVHSVDSPRLMAALEKEAAKKQRSASKKASRQTEEPASAPEARPSQAAKSASVPKERPEPSGDALFGPQADRSPIVSRSAQEEAMLFYEDDDDEEAGND